MDIVDELRGFALCCGASEAGDGAFRVVSLSGVGSDTTEMNLRGVLRDGAATITALRKRVGELEGALEPFAKAGGTPMFGDEEQVPLSFKGKHFRRARNALSANCHGADSPQNGADSAALRAKGGEHGDA